MNGSMWIMTGVVLFAVIAAVAADGPGAPSGGGPGGVVAPGAKLQLLAGEQASEKVA